ncbi:uncharacterized protein LOC134844418 isoform X2 [Symsagittifera roscoffensis]|uniref:uncharacterized protein LOC134844418 isoform X2 n=1 Tax=Symsagittifera roscoffensis TaxID=84072 RepID=UPI00307B115F
MVNNIPGPASPTGDVSPKRTGGGFQLLDTDFIRDTFGFSNRGVISDRRNNTKGIQIATNVDLSQWCEEEFIHLEMPDDLIDKLAPYLGKRGLEAAQALKEMPLEITWFDADLLSKAVMRYWAKYYANIYDESVKSIKGRHLLSWEELDVRVRTIIYVVLQQVPSVSTVPNFWNHLTRQHWKHVHSELKIMYKRDLLRKGGESEYFNEFLKQENLLNEKTGGQHKMVTLQLPDINSGLSRSLDNLNSSTSGFKEESSGGHGGSGFSIKDNHLLSLSACSGGGGMGSSELSSAASSSCRPHIGSPIPHIGSVNMRRSRSPSMNGQQLLIDNFVNSDSAGDESQLSAIEVRAWDKDPCPYPNKKHDHLGRKHRSSSFNSNANENNCDIKVPPPGYSEITVVDDITVMHKLERQSISKASSCAFTSSTPVSGSPNPSRRGSFTLEPINSPVPSRRSSTHSKSSNRHNERDRRGSMINLLPPLDNSLRQISDSKRDSQIRSLEASPTTQRRKMLFSSNSITDNNGKLYVPSFGR